MANDIDIAQTIVNQFAMTLENELVAAKAVSTQKYDKNIDADNGLETRERVPPRYVSVTTNGSTPAYSAIEQDTVVGTEIIRVNSVESVGLGYSDFERIKTFSDAVESQALKGVAEAMAHKIDARILNTAALAAYNWVGTPSTNLNELDDFMAGYTRLKEEGVEDTDLLGVLTFADKQKLQKYITELPAPAGDAKAALRSGAVGVLGGIMTNFTQQLPTLTVGTRVASASVTVDGADQNVNYRDVATPTQQGWHCTQELDITLANGITVVPGDVFTIAGVDAYDNRLKASLGRLQQFTVVTGATGDGDNNATIRIAPAIIVPNTGSGKDPLVNTAHGTVTAVPGAAAAMTFLGASGTSHKQRMIIQKQAISLNSAQLIAPKTGTMRRQTLSKVPITVRMWWNSDFANATHAVRFDTAVDVNIMDRRRIVRVNGA